MIVPIQENAIKQTFKKNASFELSNVTTPWNAHQLGHLIPEGYWSIGTAPKTSSPGKNVKTWYQKLLGIVEFGGAASTRYPQCHETQLDNVYPSSWTFAWDTLKSPHNGCSTLQTSNLVGG